MGECIAAAAALTVLALLIQAEAIKEMNVAFSAGVIPMSHIHVVGDLAKGHVLVNKGTASSSPCDAVSNLSALPFHDAVSPELDGLVYRWSAVEFAAFFETELSPLNDAQSDVMRQSDMLLDRPGTYNETWADFIRDVLSSGCAADVTLVSGILARPSVTFGLDFKREDVGNIISMTCGNAYRTEVMREFVKADLEDVVDNIFNPDLYCRQDSAKRRTGETIDPSRSNAGLGWTSVNTGTEGSRKGGLVDIQIKVAEAFPAEPKNSVEIILERKRT